MAKSAIKSPVTTITGIVVAILSIVSALGLISNEQSTTIQHWLPTFVEGITAIILIFKAKD